MQYSLKQTTHTRGQTLIIVLVFFIFLSSAVVTAFVSPVLRDARIVRSAYTSNTAYALTEALTEDILYRLKSGYPVGDTESLTLNGETANATIEIGEDGISKIITTTGTVDTTERTVQVSTIIDTGISFNFGIQTDTGGIILQNSSSVLGNVFSNGTVVGTGGGVGNVIGGSVISAGASGSITGIHATSSVYANSVMNTLADESAYCRSQSGVSAGDMTYCPSTAWTLPATSTLSIPDSVIDTWEQAATTGTTKICTSGTYKITTSVTLGPAVIPCNLEVSGSGHITLSGMVWVQGNIVTQNSAIIGVDPSLGRNSAALIADNQSNRSTGSFIDIQNTSTFQNSGTQGSYVFLVSMNTSAKNGGGVKAIQFRNSASGDVVTYAPYGEIELANNISLREVSAWRIRLKNSAQVVYETGLANLLFTSGPSGSYQINSWEEIE